MTRDEAIEGTAARAALAATLAAVLRDEMPAAEALRVVDLARTATGLSRENWTFEVTWRERDEARTRRMILRRDPVASVLRTDRAREFQVLRALERTPVPAPAVRWVDAEGAVFGSPAMIMDLVDGSCEWFVLNGSRPLDQRLHLARRFIEVLAEIQRVDWRALGLDDGIAAGAHAGRTELARWETELRRVQLEPLPEMELSLDWLRRHAPQAQDTVLVHGDFKPGNALLMDNDVSAMLDWETAHLGDPLEDLGWITNPARAREHQIRGVWEQAQIVAAYSAATGRSVDRQQLLWWNVFSCWKLATIVLTGVHGFVGGDLNRIYHSPAWLFQHMFTLMRASDHAPNRD